MNIFFKVQSTALARQKISKVACGVFATAVLSATSLHAQPSSGPVHFPANMTNVPSAIGPSNSAIIPGPAPVAAQPPAPPVQLTPVPAAAPAPATPSDVDTAEDIRDIRPPISIPYEWLWAAYFLTALLVAALAYALWRWLRSRKERAKLPFEIALEKLDAARALMTEDTVREYAFTVSEVIRVYIEQRFGERAAHRTTEEFLADLLHTSGTQLVAHRAALEDFLGHCDLIKFARWQLTKREMESMHESARTFILNTRPQGQAATPPAPPMPPVPPVPAQPEPAVT